MGVSAWYLIETPGREMKRLPAAKLHRFYDGKQAIPLDGRDDLRMVQVALTVSHRRAVQVHRVFWTRYEVTAEGLHDPRHRASAMHLAMRVIDLPLLLDEDNVVNLDPHIAQQEMDRHHRWRPSEAQLQQVAAYLNKAAIQPPIVVIARGDLLPV